MIYLKWLLMVPVMLVISVLTFPLAFVLPFFAVQREGWQNNGNRWNLGWYLPTWLSWFQTPDNSLAGDYGWKTEHWQWRYKLPAPLRSYACVVGWLWRNPGYGVGVVRFDSAVPVTATYSGNAAVNDSPGVEGWCLVHAGGLFQLVWVKRISAGKCVYCNLGWNIKGLINDPRNRYTATFAFSPRVSTWKD
jgi:hypothetical protein